METDQPTKWPRAQTFTMITVVTPLDKKSPILVNHGRPSSSNVGDIHKKKNCKMFSNPEHCPYCTCFFCSKTAECCKCMKMLKIIFDYYFRLVFTQKEEGSRVSEQEK